jgi:hypothetical protein
LRIAHLPKLFGRHVNGSAHFEFYPHGGVCA